MFRSRLFAEIVLPYGAFVLLAGSLSVWIGGAIHDRVVRDGALSRVRMVAQTVAERDDVLRVSSDSWTDGLRRVAESTGVRLTVIDGLGTAIADTERDPSLLGDLRNLPEVRQARSSEKVEQVVADDGRLVVVVPIVERSRSNAANAATQRTQRTQILGYILAQGSPATVTHTVRRWRLWAVVIFATAGLIGLLLAARTVHRLDAAIGTITRSARSAAAGVEAASETPAGSEPKRSPPAESISTELAAYAADLDTHSDRSRRETARLKTNAERLSTVLSSMAEGVLAIDRDERILVANPAAANLLDLSDVPLVGRRLWEAVRVPAIREAARAAFEGRDTSQMEIELPRTQIAIALRASRLPGEPAPGVVLVLHDVTELRRLENLRREFVSNVSHELKTPLASIQAYTDTLLNGAIDDHENNVRFLNRISEQADRLHSLILDLLRLARIEAGTDVFEIQKLSASKIIMQSCDEHAAVAAAKGVTLMMEPPDEPVRLRVDPDGMRTILDNLLDNAINYTPSGGRVTVRWGRRGDSAVIEVADTGIGIPPEHLSRVFERFHRVDKARDRDRGGTGLGLAIVKHLAGVFEGQVEVESEVDCGSTFRIRLPLADKPTVERDIVHV